MTGTVGLESFLSSIACLCASSFGPPSSNSFVTNLEMKFQGSQMDLSILQILISSKSKISIQNTSGECTLPGSENIDARLKILEEDIKKQKEFSKKLEKQLQNLSDQKDAEINVLRERIVALETKKRPLSKNVCLFSSQNTLLWPFKIFCDEKLDKKYGRGWMLMAQRFNGKGHFYQKWDSYVKGIGPFDPKQEFFIGLEILSILTNKFSHELLFVLIDRDNVERYAHYDLFVISSEKDKFALKTLGNYTGHAGDSLIYHVGQKFSTWDNDNDESSENCAAQHSGAWWYKSCHESNLFGIHESRRLDDSEHLRNGMIWSTFHNTNGGYLSSMRMYIKPKED